MNFNKSRTNTCIAFLAGHLANHGLPDNALPVINLITPRTQ